MDEMDRVAEDKSRYRVNREDYARRQRIPFWLMVPCGVGAIALGTGILLGFRRTRRADRNQSISRKYGRSVASVRGSATDPGE